MTETILPVHLPAAPGGNQYPWLLCDYNSEAWLFRNDNPAVRASGNSVNWARAEETTGRRLTDPGALLLLNTCKSYVCALDYNGINGEKSKWSTMRTRALRVSVIGRIVLASGHSSFSSLVKADIVALMETLALRRGYKSSGSLVSDKVRRQYNIILLELYCFSRDGIIANGLAFDPRLLLNGPTRREAAKPRHGGATPRIPEYIARPLLNTAIEWFESFSRGSLNSEKRSRKKILEDVEYFFADRLKNLRGRRPSSLDLAMTTCFIIIAAFTAFRISEQLSVESKGITRSRYGFCLQSRVHKTSKRIGGLLTTRPVPPIVQQAIVFSELIGVSEKHRACSIFALPGPNGSLQRDDAGKWAERIDKFARLADIPLFKLAEAEVPWHFTSQQFRRFFALFYVRRYNGPVDPLRHHFRHVTDDMILYYTNDPETAQFLALEKYEFTSDLMQSIASGDVKATGSFSKTLINLGASYKSQALTPQQIEAMVRDWIAEEKLELVGTPYGLCASSQARAAFAVCGSTADGLPNIAHRTMDGCLVCPNGCQTEHDIPALRLEYLVNKEVTESIREGPIYEAAIERMKKIRTKLTALEGSR